MEVVEEMEQEGSSTLIIGRGRVGKSGFTSDLVEESRPEKLIIVAPRITNQKKLKKYKFVDEPIMSPQQLAAAYNRAVDEYEKEGSKTVGLLILLTNKPVKGQPSIWEVLRDPLFRDFTIWGEELAILTAEKADWDAFDYFIRVVGQNNQKFFVNTHRMKREINPAWVSNFQRIFYVGRLAAVDELHILYDESTVSTTMTFEQFQERLSTAPEKYDWWAPFPNKEAAFLILS